MPSPAAIDLQALRLKTSSCSADCLYEHQLRPKPETCDDCLDAAAERIAEFIKWDSTTAREWKLPAYMEEAGVGPERARVLQFRVLDLCQTENAQASRQMRAPREEMGIEHFISPEPTIEPWADSLFSQSAAWVCGQIEGSYWSATRLAFVAAASIVLIAYVASRGCQ